jgi:hypothetical protein
MESEGSLPCSQEPATGSCAQSIEFRRHSPKQSLFRRISILFSNLLLGLQRVNFPFVVLTESFYAFIVSLTRATCHALYQTARRRNPQDHIMKLSSRKNLKLH